MAVGGAVGVAVGNDIGAVIGGAVGVVVGAEVGVVGAALDSKSSTLASSAAMVFAWACTSSCSTVTLAARSLPVDPPTEAAAGGAGVGDPLPDPDDPDTATAMATMASTRAMTTPAIIHREAVGVVALGMAPATAAFSPNLTAGSVSSGAPSVVVEPPPRWNTGLLTTALLGSPTERNTWYWSSGTASTSR